MSDDPFKRPVRKDSNPYTRIRHIGSPPNNITNVQITPPAYQTGTPTGSVPGIPVALTGSTMGPTITQRVKYDEWLKVEVCREFQRDKCNRKPVSMSHLIRIPTVKLKTPRKAFLKSESRTSVTFKL